MLSGHHNCEPVMVLLRNFECIMPVKAVLGEKPHVELQLLARARQQKWLLGCRR